MYLLKFSFLVFLLSLNAYSFDEQACLSLNFSTRISHKGQPFGLMENVLNIDKSNCIITVNHSKMKWHNNQWVVDVCREPVHIKKGSKGVEVQKRGIGCQNQKKNEEVKPFCVSAKEIKNVVQDHGLIFAEGEKENSNSDHGKIYCAYVLLTRYLESGEIFTRNRATPVKVNPESSQADM